MMNAHHYFFFTTGFFGRAGRALAAGAAEPFDAPASFKGVTCRAGSPNRPPPARSCTYGDLDRRSYCSPADPTRSSTAMRSSTGWRSRARVVAVDPPGFGFSTPEPDLDFTPRFFGTTSAAHGRARLQSNVAGQTLRCGRIRTRPRSGSTP